VIGHSQPDLVELTVNGEGYRRCRGRVADRVEREIRNDPIEQELDLDWREIFLDDHRDSLIAKHRTQSIDGLVRQLAEVVPVEREVKDTTVEARQIEQITDHVVQPVGSVMALTF
jgi:hypothetical protein